MEFGTNKILTIAIQTYNRGKFLKIALENLLPQCSLFSESIEIIISDNASIDNTQEVILSAQKSYPQLNILANRNNENLGFHGNFTKCMVLASSNYVWLLSDDDYVEDNVIATIIEILKKETLGVLFLEFLRKPKESNKFNYFKCTPDELIKKSGNRISLISSVIFNRKGVDKVQLEKFNTNSLIGMVPILNALTQFKENIILEGQLLKIINNDTISFNPLKIFTLDLHCILSFFSELSLKRLRNAFLCTNILNHYIPWKFQGMFQNEGINDKVIYNLYKSCWSYWFIMIPFVVLPQKHL